MARNDFEPFATDYDANVEDQPGWVANPTRMKGFVSGWTKSIEMNKALRQPSFVASALSEWINQILVSVTIDDNGNRQEWVNEFDAALRSVIRSMITQAQADWDAPADNNLYGRKNHAWSVVPPQLRYRPPPGSGFYVYVDNAGNDNNDGLTPTTAFQHIQRAVDYMRTNVDLGPSTALISINAGYYPENVIIGGPLLGQRGIENFLFVTTNGQVHIHGTGYTLTAFGGAMFFLYGDFLLSCSWSGGGPNAVMGGFNCRIGTYGGRLMFGDSPGCDHVSMAVGGEFTCQVPTDYAINGGGNTHWHTDSGGRIIVTDNNVTIMGGCAFDTFAQASDVSVILPIRLNYVNAGFVSARKYLANLNGVINTAGAGVGALPGGTPGATGSGGQYV